jgi:excinuclease UvrABC nuclease subunit
VADEWHNLFDHKAGFDPAGDFETFLKQVPARGVVYLMTDAEDRPVQLLCVGNLRQSLKRRLGPQEQPPAAPESPAPAKPGPSKRVNYRELVRRVHWRRVDSPFEADWIYYEVARRVFPQTYQGMVGFRPAWFVHVDPDANFPRYVKTVQLGRPGVYIGPVEDKHAAARLIELAEDAFDLCRYYNVLIESPRGRPCAYKEMGKCPAPCDGSISVPQYRRLVEWSAATLVSPGEMLADQERRMRAAAADLRFETAAKIKAFIAQLSHLGKAGLRHARRLEDFAFLSLQRGPRAGTAKLFLITPGKIEELAGLIAEPGPAAAADLLHLSLALAAERRNQPVDPTGAERVGVVAHHLFAAKNTRGVFLHLHEAEEKALLRAYRDLGKQKPAEEIEGEGVVKELQAME